MRRILLSGSLINAQPVPVEHRSASSHCWRLQRQLPLNGVVSTNPSPFYVQGQPRERALEHLDLWPHQPMIAGLDALGRLNTRSHSTAALPVSQHRVSSSAYSSSACGTTM